MQHTDLNMVPRQAICFDCGAAATGTFAGKPSCPRCGTKRTMTAELGGPAGKFEPFPALPIKRGPGRPRKIW